MAPHIFEMYADDQQQPLYAGVIRCPLPGCDCLSTWAARMSPGGPLVGGAAAEELHDDHALFRRRPGRAWEAHRKTARHRAEEARQRQRQQRMDEQIAAAEAEAARTCELTGGPGVLMVRGGWYATLDPQMSEAEGWERA
jgi:hypothetical protein